MWERIVALALPCYVANGTPVVTARLFPRRHPVDFGLKFFDGRRLFGDSKSIEGFLSGFGAGLATGYFLSMKGMLSVEEGAVLSFGTMLGDLIGSFIKRRLGLEAGSPAPLLDQLSFLITALALYGIFFGFPEPTVALALFIITPPLHLATNVVAYKLKLKDKPW